MSSTTYGLFPASQAIPAPVPTPVPTEVKATAPKLLAFLAFCTIVLPEDANIYVAGLLLTLPRLIMLILAPMIFFLIAQQMSAPTFRYTMADRLMPYAPVWMFLSVTIVEGVDKAMVGVGAAILEFTMAYYMTRGLITKPGQAAAFARVLVWCAAVAGVMGLLDVLTGRHIVHDAFAALSGYGKGWRLDLREGMLRGQGPIEHPILLGSICSFGLLLAITTMRGFKRLAGGGLCLVGVLSAVSSAPIGAMLMSWGFLLYRRFTPGWDARWRVLGVTVGSALLLFWLVHPRPFGFIFNYLTFDAATGYYRLMIWNFAGDVVLDNPIFGVGLASEWLRPDWMYSNSVDSLWLRSAMSFGIPGSVLLGLITIGACDRRLDTLADNGLTEEDRKLGLALSIILFLYIYLGFTVHFWGSAWVMMGFMIAMRAQIGSMAALALSMKANARR